MNDNWVFDEAPNTACFTTSFVLAGSPILRVYHNYDGDWQFLGPPDQPAISSVGQLVCLSEMISRDPKLCELHDLPCGWHAIRVEVDDPWYREKDHPFPTFNENRFYLEDAVWMSQYRDDVNPPTEEIRESLVVGQYVKLLFRFRAENASREDNDTERMWVLITELDNDGFYVGTLENDPQHNDVLKYGDTIRFHPLHIMTVLSEDHS